MADRTQTRILNALKSGGPQTAADLAGNLAVTTVAVRQHLDGLMSSGLVDFQDIKGTVGRPRRIWALTTAGHQQFPDSHSTLILGLIDGVRNLYGDEGLDRLISRREDETRERYTAELAEVKEPADKLRRLAELRSDEGYMAEAVEDDAGWLLIENHCSICAAATACQGFCRSELMLFQEILGPDLLVERTEHLLSGGRRCVYRVCQPQSRVA